MIGRLFTAVFGSAACLGVVAAFSVVSLSGQGGDSGTSTFGASENALADIPALYLDLYRMAGESRGIDWAILAAIGSIETDHGRSTAAGVKSGVNFAGCCAGPMQFLITGPNGGTWGAYAVDGNRDRRACPAGTGGCVYDPHDAIPAAADLLVASGAPGDYERAIFAYNHAGWYVADVLAKASEYRGALQSAGGGLGLPPGQLAINVQNASVLLELAAGARPRVTLNAIHRTDLTTGQIDARVISLLVAIARRHTIIVTSLKGDHGLLTASGNMSNHSAGRAFDIGSVDREVCNSIAHGRTGRCWQLAQEIARIRGPLHPTELIFGIDPDGPGPALAAGDHTDHIHAGWDN